MPFCPNCHSHIDVTDKFCRHCGNETHPAIKKEKNGGRTTGRGPIECRSIRYFPEEEESIQQRMALFGWTLKSRNGIPFDTNSVADPAFSLGSHVFATTSISDHSKKVSYISATFVRDPKTIPEYERIAALDKEYDKLIEKMATDASLLKTNQNIIKNPEGKLLGYIVVLIVLGILTLLFGMLAGALNQIRGTFVTLLIVASFALALFVGGVVMLIRKRNQITKKGREELLRIKSDAQKTRKRMIEITDEAKSIIQED